MLRRSFPAEKEVFEVDYEQASSLTFHTHITVTDASLCFMCWFYLIVCKAIAHDVFILFLSCV